MSQGKMKIVLYPTYLALLLCLLTQNSHSTGYSSSPRHDTENAINEIEDHLHAIENDHSLPSSEEQSAYKKHFQSHNNSLDSVSDFANDRHGESHNSSQMSGQESGKSGHEHEHDSPHDSHDGKKSIY